ncbi:MAG: hypothetical protein AAGA46_05850 [Cyanobacteria bacterium P01_F01_bin.13]
MDFLNTTETLEADDLLDLESASALNCLDISNSSTSYKKKDAFAAAPVKGESLKLPFYEDAEETFSEDGHQSNAFVPPSEMAKMFCRGAITAEPLTVAGASDYRFSVTLPEQGKVDLTNLGTGEVIVTGPNGYCQFAGFVGVKGDAIHYRVKAPNGIWTQADNGIYRITLAVDEAISLGVMQVFQVSVETGIGSCLLQNGNFESGLTNWVTLAGTERVSKTNAYIGLASLVLSTMDSGTNQTVRIAPGMILQLTGYGRSTSQGYSSFGMMFFDAKGSLLSRSDVGAIRSSQWCDYFVVAIAPTRTAYVQVWTYQGFDHGLTYIDGLSLRQISPEDVPPCKNSQFVLENTPLTSANNIFSSSVLYSPNGKLLKASVKPEVYQWVQECLRYGDASGTYYDR